jgi:outer membrane protein assembly factor BamB
MRKLLIFASSILFCGILIAADWITDGGDVYRSGWAKNETILTKSNVKNLKLLWKIQTSNQVRALHALMAPLVAESVPTTNGDKEMVYVVGASDNLYAIDVKAGKIGWQKHFTYTAPAGRGGGGGGGGNPNASTDPAHLGFLGPGGSTDTPVIGPRDSNGHRPIYVTDGGGMLHTLDTGNGEDLKSPFALGTSKFGLQLYKNMIVFAGRGAIEATRLDDPEHKVIHTVGLGRSGGLWGVRGPAIDSRGIVWSTTGDGQYDPSNPENLILANSVVGFELDGDRFKVKDWYTPTNWEWLRKRDLDPNNTPTIFNYKGRELMAASGKECRMYLLDTLSPGGADHQTPMYKTEPFCNEEVDFQDAGSWGALSSWEDASGTRWVIAPFWGPVHSKYKFPISNAPAPQEGGEAAFKVVENNGKPELAPVWVSRDMFRGAPPVIANGMVFAYGSGEETKQAWPDIGLNFDSFIRASRSKHVTIYILDATNGKELWSSGDQVASFNHMSGLTVANGKLYLGTYDGYLYCFGL